MSEECPPVLVKCQWCSKRLFQNKLNKHQESLYCKMNKERKLMV